MGWCQSKMLFLCMHFQQVSSLEASDAESILDTRLETEKRYKCPLIYQPSKLKRSLILAMWFFRTRLALIVSNVCLSYIFSKITPTNCAHPAQLDTVHFLPIY